MALAQDTLKNLVKVTTIFGGLKHCHFIPLLLSLLFSPLIVKLYIHKEAKMGGENKVVELIA